MIDWVHKTQRGNSLTRYSIGASRIIAKRKWQSVGVFFFSNRPCDARWLLAVWAYSFPFNGFHKRFVLVALNKPCVCVWTIPWRKQNWNQNVVTYCSDDRSSVYAIRPYCLLLYLNRLPWHGLHKKQIWDAGVCVVCCAALLNISVYNNLLRYFMDRWPQMWWCLGFRFFTYLKCGEETEKCRTRCT